MHRLGVVSFLNSRPLVAGLAGQARVTLTFDVPSRLPALLDSGAVDVALLPVVDVLRAGGKYAVVSDACIGCDGETMTVRVFSQVPPDRITTLHVDPDSHTSVALVTVLWRELYGRSLTLAPLVDAPDRARCEAVLLIGDKVVDPQRGSFAYEVDLGGAWRQQTGLPFVFAVWACRRSEGVGAQPDVASLAALLSAARDRGVAEAREIAVECGPRLGWSPDLAVRYLTRCLQYNLDQRAIEGVRRFAALCARADLIDPGVEIDWPDALAPHTLGT